MSDKQDRKEEYEDAKAVLELLRDTDNNYGLEVEFLVAFIQHIQVGDDVRQAIFHACCEWDL